MTSRWQNFCWAAMFVGVAALAGCRSHVVKVNLINISAEPISTIIVDYPSATFGKDRLAPHETFSYTIKPLESGPLKVRFSDARGADHTCTGPMLHQNDEGSIDIRINQQGAAAIPNLVSH